MTYGEALVRVIVGHLETRANDPWPDELWPAANNVLLKMAGEIAEARDALRQDAWRIVKSESR